MSIQSARLALVPFYICIEGPELVEGGLGLPSLLIAGAKATNIYIGSVGVALTSCPS